MNDEVLQSFGLSVFYPKMTTDGKEGGRQGKRDVGR